MPEVAMTMETTVPEAAAVAHHSTAVPAPAKAAAVPAARIG
jgi:hypothetical protein